MSESVRVLVADSEPTRVGVRLALDGYATICAEAGDVEQAVAAAVAEGPEICLIGRQLRGDGIEAVRRIAELLPHTRIVLLAGGDDVDDLLAALRGGAVGYVAPGFDGQQLRRAIDAVLASEAAVPRSMVLDLVDELRALERAADDHLTVREAQILSMLRRGHSTSVIAARLAISPVTVRRHISKLMHKVGATDRGELVTAPTPLRSV